jgi:hypothetical protein
MMMMIEVIRTKSGVGEHIVVDILLSSNSKIAMSCKI